jgi:NADH-quinone oxidoreductase subunit J
MVNVVFYILAAVALAGGLSVIFSRNPVASALSLVLTLLAVAGVYLTLDAEFLAAIQVLVYAGAIVVLFLFVILLVDQERTGRGLALMRLPVPVAVLILTVVWAAALSGVDTPETAVDAAGSGAAAGQLLFTKYVFPFEAVSVILLAALIGAVVLAKRKGVK